MGNIIPRSVPQTLIIRYDNDTALEQLDNLIQSITPTISTVGGDSNVRK